MAVHNADIAAIFTEIADLLEIEAANPFRIRAYRNAARVVGDLGVDIRTVIASDRGLTRLAGIGKDLAGKIREIVDTGQCAFLESLRREVPPAVSELLRIPNLGPKRVRLLWQDLGIQTVEQLYRAACDGRIQEVPASAKSQKRRSGRPSRPISARTGASNWPLPPSTPRPWWRICKASPASIGSRWPAASAASVKRSAISTSSLSPRPAAR